MQQVKKIALLILLFCGVIAPQVGHSNPRISGGLGIGSSTTKNEISVTEGPLTQMYTVENVFHSRMVGGVEHFRSFKPSTLSTAISFTGCFAQFYLSAVPTPYLKAEDLPDDQIIYNDLGYFIGSGIGLVQSSRMPDDSGNTSNAVGVYLSPRVGIDLQLTKAVGVRSSLHLGLLVLGSGSVSSASLLETIYWSF